MARAGTMTWIPPDEDVGPVTFYVTGNAANFDFTPEEDYIFSGSQPVSGPGSKTASAALLSSSHERRVGGGTNPHVLYSSREH